MRNKVQRRLKRSLAGDNLSSDDDEGDADGDMAPLRLPGAEGLGERQFTAKKKKKDKSGKKGKFARTPVGIPTNSPKPYITPIATTKPSGSKPELQIHSYTIFIATKL